MIDITGASLTYNGLPVSTSNKVPAGYNFLIAIAIMEQEGDDGLFIISGSYNSSTETVSNLDKLFADIAAAVADNKFCVLKLTNGSNVHYLPAVGADSSKVVFADDIDFKKIVTVTAQNTATVTQTAHTHVQSDITGLSAALAAKADLVSGKVPASQLPGTSWNDLTDRPFYEETIPAINITDPDYTSAAAVSFNASSAGITVPCKALRVADYISAEHMVGATIALASDQGSTIDTDRDEIGNQDVMPIDHGYTCWPKERPQIFAVDQDQTTVAMSDETLQFSVILPTAGTYFIYVDATELVGVIMYPTSLQKAASTVVHKLDNRFLDCGNILIDATCTGTQLQSGSFQLSLPSGTAAAALSQSDYNKRNVFLQLTASGLDLIALVPIQVARTVEDSSGNVMPQSAVGSTTFFSDFTGTMQQWNINATVTMTDTVTVVLTPMVKDAFWVTATLSESGGTITATLDKTYAQLCAAFAAGLTVKMKTSLIVGQLIELLPACRPTSDSTRAIAFIGWYPANPGVTLWAFEIHVDSQDNVTVSISIHSALTSASGVSF